MKLTANSTDHYPNHRVAQSNIEEHGFEHLQGFVLFFVFNKYSAGLEMYFLYDFLSHLFFSLPYFIIRM